MSNTINDVPTAANNYNFNGKVVMLHEIDGVVNQETVKVELERLKSVFETTVIDITVSVLQGLITNSTLKKGYYYAIPLSQINGNGQGFTGVVYLLALTSNTLASSCHVQHANLTFPIWNGTFDSKYFWKLSELKDHRGNVITNGNSFDAIAAFYWANPSYAECTFYKPSFAQFNTSGEHEARKINTKINATYIDEATEISISNLSVGINGYFKTGNINGVVKNVTIENNTRVSGVLAGGNARPVLLDNVIFKESIEDILNDLNEFIFGTGNAASPTTLTIKESTIAKWRVPLVVGLFTIENSKIDNLKINPELAAPFTVQNSSLKNIDLGNNNFEAFEYRFENTDLENISLKSIASGEKQFGIVSTFCNLKNINFNSGNEYVTKIALNGCKNIDSAVSSIIPIYLGAICNIATFNDCILKGGLTLSNIQGATFARAEFENNSYSEFTLLQVGGIEITDYYNKGYLSYTNYNTIESSNVRNLGSLTIGQNTEDLTNTIANNITVEERGELVTYATNNVNAIHVLADATLNTQGGSLNHVKVLQGIVNADIYSISECTFLIKTGSAHVLAVGEVNNFILI